MLFRSITGFEMRRGELEHNVFERAILMFRRPAGLREGEETEKQTEKGTEKGKSQIETDESFARNSS